MNKIVISHPERVVYEASNITKLDIINYYNQISKIMFPFLDKRLLSIIRCHNNTSNCFMKKHPTYNSSFIAKKYVGDNEYFYLKSSVGIVEQAQLGTIEFHTWASQVNKLEQPNIMIFDLDPDEKIDFKQLKQGVLDLKNILDSLNLKSFLKTSGGKGYHVLVPFNKSKNWESFYNFSYQIAQILEQKFPSLYTTNIRKMNREGKIFVDYMRNSKGATCIAPFSLRARKEPTISMPISFQDLNKFAPNYFNIFNAVEYIKLKNPWQNFFTIEQSLK